MQRMMGVFVYVFMIDAAFLLIFGHILKGTHAVSIAAHTY